MYLLEFGQKEKLRCYLFEMEGDYFATPEKDWKKITGKTNAVLLNYDPVGKYDTLLPNIIKTSAQLTLLKTDADDFTDIIESAENRWKCVITKGIITKCWDDNEPEMYPEGKRTPWLTSEGDAPWLTSGEGDVLFIGTLTNQIYSEAYIPVPEVSFTFHDRIGELNEVIFNGSKDLIPLSQLLAEILQGTSIGSGLEIQLPYQLADETPILPHELLIDIRGLKGEKRLDVLNTVLNDLGLQLFADWHKSNGIANAFKLSQYGSGVVRYIGDATHVISTVERYTVNQAPIGSQVFYKNSTDEPKDIHTITQDTPMIRGGMVQQIRRMKSVTAKNDLRAQSLTQSFLEEKTLTAPSINDDSAFVTLDEHTIITREWGYGQPWNYLLSEIKPLAKVVRFGTQKKLAVYGRSFNNLNLTICSQRILAVDKGEPFELTAEFYNTFPPGNPFELSLYVLAAEIDSGDVYYWDGGNWQSFTGSYLPPYYDITAEGYTTLKKEIYPPSFGSGSVFNFVIGFRSVAGTATVLTGFDFRLKEPDDGLPPFLQVVTRINNENRGNVELSNKLLTLPNIGNVMYWSGGLFYQEEGEEEVSALHGLTYAGNYASLLVHNSELVGNQSQRDRAKLKGTVFLKDVEPLVITVYEWSDFKCEKSVGDNTGRGRATTLTITTTGVSVVKNVYKLFEAFDSYAGISESFLLGLNVPDYEDRASDFMDYLEDLTGIDVKDRMNNFAIKEEMYGCEVPKTGIAIKLFMFGQHEYMGVVGFSGAIKLKSGGITVDYVVAYSDKYSQTKILEHTFNADAGTYELDFNEIIGYKNGAVHGVDILWSLDGGQSFNSSRVISSLNDNQTVIVKVKLQ